MAERSVRIGKEGFTDRVLSPASVASVYAVLCDPLESPEQFELYPFLTEKFGIRGE